MEDLFAFFKPLLDFFHFDPVTFINNYGDNPFAAMGYLFLNGGWLFLIWLAWQIAIHEWQHYRQHEWDHHKRHPVTLTIDIPKMHEQTPRAIDNMFAFLAGGHSPNTWVETWFDGKTQDTISMEIVSIEGAVRFYIHTTTTLRDLVESAIYAQYPEAVITEVEDYAKKVNKHLPDEETDCWATEMVPVKSDIFPLRTYPMFEDKVSGEFKDPLSALLESFSRIGTGEQLWYQIVLTPIDQKDYQKKVEEYVKKLTGQRVEHKESLVSKIATVPSALVTAIVSDAFGIGFGGEKKKGGDSSQRSNVQFLTEGEKIIVAGIEMKASKIVFLANIRFIYVAKKDKMMKSRATFPFVGAMKQFNTNNMQSIKPETKRVGVSGALWFFKAQRNRSRKLRLMTAYQNRSNWLGNPKWHLCTEELASLWHFPLTTQVKAPQLSKTAAKRTEPPINIPFAP